SCASPFPCRACKGTCWRLSRLLRRIPLIQRRNSPGCGTTPRTPRPWVKAPSIVHPLPAASRCSGHTRTSIASVCCALAEECARVIDRSVVSQVPRRHVAQTAGVAREEFGPTQMAIEIDCRIGGTLDQLAGPADVGRTYHVFVAGDGRRYPRHQVAAIEDPTAPGGGQRVEKRPVANAGRADGDQLPGTPGGGRQCCLGCAQAMAANEQAGPLARHGIQPESHRIADAFEGMCEAVVHKAWTVPACRQETRIDADVLQ